MDLVVDGQRGHVLITLEVQHVAVVSDVVLGGIKSVDVVVVVGGIAASGSDASRTPLDNDGTAAKWNQPQGATASFTNVAIVNINDNNATLEGAAQLRTDNRNNVLTWNDTNSNGVWDAGTAERARYAVDYIQLSTGDKDVSAAVDQVVLGSLSILDNQLNVHGPLLHQVAVGVVAGIDLGDQSVGGAAGNLISADITEVVEVHGVLGVVLHGADELHHLGPVLNAGLTIGALVGCQLGPRR